MLNLYYLTDAYLVASKTGQVVKRSYNKWYVYMIIILLNLLVAKNFKDYINLNWFTAHRVPTKSMEPYLQVGDHFIGDYKYYKTNTVWPGDVIILKFPKNPEIKYIERCIAIGGQTVEIRDKSLYVDGIFVPDSTEVQFTDKNVFNRDYRDPEIFPENAGNRDNYGPVTVPNNQCFVLGDNRDNSYDSRYWGFVPIESVVAKPLYIYWSDDKNRIGKII